jgi:hypothetical protein
MLLYTRRVVTPLSVRKLLVFRIESCRHGFPDRLPDVDVEAATAERDRLVELLDERLADRLEEENTTFRTVVNLGNAYNNTSSQSHELHDQLCKKLWTMGSLVLFKSKNVFF